MPGQEMITQAGWGLVLILGLGLVQHKVLDASIRHRTEWAELTGRPKIRSKKKFERIRETLNLSIDADDRTDTKKKFK